eukprot:13745012-Ditylum_brightwellii.AAC.1
MDTSLFNGNLAHGAGLSICTGPYDAHMQLGIKDLDRGLLVPMVRRGNSVAFNASNQIMMKCYMQLQVTIAI